MKKNLKKILPWLIAAGIFYFLFRQTPPADILHAVLYANIPLLIFYMVAYFFVVMIIDCWGLKTALSRFVTPLAFAETILVRGATYLLMIINYNLGQGGMAVYLKRTHQAPIFKTLGTILYVTLADLTVMLSFMLIALLVNNPVYQGFALRPYAQGLALIFYPCLLIWVTFWLNLNSAFIQKLRKVKIVEKLLHHDIFYTFKEAKLIDYFKILAIRAPLIFCTVSALYLMIDGFHSAIPFVNVYMYGPIIMFTGVLPLTPGGLGTSQAMFVEFFKIDFTSPLIATAGLTPEQILLTGSLMGAFGNLILKALFGFYCLSKKSKDLFTQEP